MKGQGLVFFAGGRISRTDAPVKGESIFQQLPQGSPLSLAVSAEVVLWYLGDEDAFISGIKRIASMALGSTSNADAKLLSWSLFNAYFLETQKSIFVSGSSSTEGTFLRVTTVLNCPEKGLN